jgi:hypothetical protein
MGIVRVRERDISTYHDALMRWPIISPKGKGRRVRANRGGGESVSCYTGGEAMGDYVSGFHPTSEAGMGLDGAYGGGKGGEYAMP